MSNDLSFLNTGTSSEKNPTRLDADSFQKLMEEFSKTDPVWGRSPLENILRARPFEMKLPEPDPEPQGFRFMSRMWGLNLYASEYCYRTVTKVKGIPSARKANTRRPYYRKVQVQEPVMYFVPGVGMVAQKRSLAGIYALTGAV